MILVRGHRLRVQCSARGQAHTVSAMGLRVDRADGHLQWLRSGRSVLGGAPSEEQVTIGLFWLGHLSVFCTLLVAALKSLRLVRDGVSSAVAPDSRNMARPTVKRMASSARAAASIPGVVLLLKTEARHEKSGNAKRRPHRLAAWCARTQELSRHTNAVGYRLPRHQLGRPCSPGGPLDRMPILARAPAEMQAPWGGGVSISRRPR